MTLHHAGKARGRRRGGEKKKARKCSKSVKCQVTTTDALEDGGKKMPWGNGGGRGSMSKEERTIWFLKVGKQVLK